MEGLTTLFDRSARSGAARLPEPLRTLYGGDLSLPPSPTPHGRPYVVANFVSTLDGVVSYGSPGMAGGGPVSGFHPQDAFVMGLLRAYADAVIVGAGTLREDSGQVRTAPFAFPQAAWQYAELRRSLRKSTAHPLNVIVSGSGAVDLAEPTFHTPGLRTLILTSRAGRERLAADPRTLLSGAEVRAAGEGPLLSVAAVVGLLHREFGVRLLLLEGGPTLFTQFLRDGLVDELFLTVAPYLAGRAKSLPRIGLAEGVAFAPDTRPQLEAISLKQAGEHLFLRGRCRMAGTA